jgi:hypothetical protein
MDLPPTDAQNISAIRSQTNIFKKLHVDLDGLSIVIPDTIASIIKIPPTEPAATSELSFGELPCTDEDAGKINRLISVMGENGKVVLLMKYQKELRRIGREIDHVHPLKFIYVIMSDPHLKSSLKKVYSDYFKWTNFMDGLGNGLTSQNKQGKISIYLDDFAKSLGISRESLQNYVDKQEWENLIIFLMNN